MAGWFDSLYIKPPCGGPCCKDANVWIRKGNVVSCTYGHDRNGLHAKDFTCENEDEAESLREFLEIVDWVAMAGAFATGQSDYQPRLDLEALREALHNAYVSELKSNQVRGHLHLRSILPQLEK